MERQIESEYEAWVEALQTRDQQSVERFKTVLDYMGAKEGDLGASINKMCLSMIIDYLRTGVSPKSAFVAIDQLLK